MTTAAGLGLGAWLSTWPARAAGEVSLPPHAAGPAGSLWAALAARRSIRQFDESSPLSLADLAALLWAAQGLSHGEGLRTAPSAGALHPLSVRVFARRVAGLPAGAYVYLPTGHRLAPAPAAAADPLADPRALPGQAWVAAAPAVLLVAGDVPRTAARYGARAERYVAIEAGAAAQDVALCAASLGLGTVVVGAFDDDALSRAWGLGRSWRPLLLMPVGRPAASA